MPREYDTALVEGYARMHAHFGELLGIYSQPICCNIMEALEEGNELTVGELRKRIPAKPYILSRHLTLLHDKKHILKSGKVYSLNNDLFYRSLVTATGKIMRVTKNAKNPRVTSDEVSMTAGLFLSMIYDKVSNILIHILIRSPKPLSEVVEIYRRNHGYISSNVIRYHLLRKRFEAYGMELPIFEFKAKRHDLTPLGRQLHTIYDECMDDYLKVNEDWMRKIWSKPVKELVSDHVSMAQPGDKFYKVLRMLGKTDFVIVRGNKVEGVVTIQHAMSLIGRVLDTENFWGSMTAREVMIPMEETDILSGNETLKDIYKNSGEFTNLYYVVHLGGGNYSVLDLNRVSKILNNT